MTRTLIHKLLILIVVLFSVVEATIGQEVNMAGLDRNLSWSLKCSKDTYISGEPVLLTLKALNTGIMPVSTDLVSGRLSMFSLQIQTIHGENIAKGSLNKKGGYSLGELSVLGGLEVKEIQMVLNRWCPTVLPEGQYVTVCSATSSQSNFFKERAIFRIIQGDEAKLKDVFKSLMSKITKSKSESERSIAAEMICFSFSPVALEFQKMIATNDTLSIAVREWAVQGLARVGNIEAVNTLAKFCRDSQVPLQLRDEALISIYKIRQKKNSEEINVIVKSVISQYKCPASTLD